MSSRSSSRRMPLLVLWVTLTAGVAAQTPPAATTAEPASLSGVVANSVTGAPVLRAHVSIRNNGAGFGQAYGAMTNGEGKFTMTKLPPGQYTVSVERAGFVMPSNAAASVTDVTLSPGDKREDCKLTLVPTGVISGRVLDGAGEPMPGINVTAIGIGSESDATDDKGQFRIGGLRPGKYRIRARGLRFNPPPT